MQIVEGPKKFVIQKIDTENVQSSPAFAVVENGTSKGRFGELSMVELDEKA